MKIKLPNRKWYPHPRFSYAERVLLRMLFPKGCMAKHSSHWRAVAIEEEKHCRELVQQIRDLKTAMCCYDEMLLLLDLVNEMWRGSPSPELAASLSRMERFDIERLVKTRLPEAMKSAKRARLMRNSDPYWPENYIMSLFVETPA